MPLIVETKTEEELIKIALNGYNYNLSNAIDNMVKQNGDINEEQLVDMMKRMSNLSGPRTIEGRIKSLMNLKINNEPKKRQKRFDPKKPHLYFLEDENEIKLYEHKKAQYENDFPLNDSSDLTILEQILLLEVEIFRLLNKQNEYNKEKSSNGKTNLINPAKELSDRREDLKKLIQILGADRRLRSGGKEDKGRDIASLSSDFEIKKDRELRARQAELDEEQQQLEDSERNRHNELSELGLLNRGFNAEDYTKKV